MDPWGLNSLVIFIIALTLLLAVVSKLSVIAAHDVTTTTYVIFINTTFPYCLLRKVLCNAGSLQSFPSQGWMTPLQWVQKG